MSDPDFYSLSLGCIMCRPGMFNAVDIKEREYLSLFLCHVFINIPSFLSAVSLVLVTKVRKEHLGAPYLMASLVLTGVPLALRRLASPHQNVLEKSSQMMQNTKTE